MIECAMPLISLQFPRKHCHSMRKHKRTTDTKLYLCMVHKYLLREVRQRLAEPHCPMSSVSAHLRQCHQPYYSRRVHEIRGSHRILLQMTILIAVLICRGWSC
ncbi:hypothetical protein HPB50_025313 [Hyalomma asiaticum]|uniref:Uncharacterized protein n=1 Tax=Hyalomma asiaticum TaxID=266040 RepID=A0ACB7SQU2_HYAAI|nr:hypothetical protein HPB50_025313 [Hyalomma asiaticum]